MEIVEVIILAVVALGGSYFIYQKITKNKSSSSSRIPDEVVDQVK